MEYTTKSSGGETVALQARQRTRAARQIELVQAHAGQGLGHQLPVALNGVQLLAHERHERRIGNGSLGHVFVQESGPSDRVRVHGLGQKLLHVEHLGAGLAQNVREGVVLLLGVLQVEGVVDPALLELRGLHVRELAPGTMQHHALQIADLAGHVNGFFRHDLSFLVQYKLSDGQHGRYRREADADRAHE